VDENNFDFSNLKEIARVIVKTFGRNCEVAIHDFVHLPNSLINIEGELTKRKPGAPITDLVLREIRQKGDEVEDISNYETVTKDGRRLKSSTAFIRNKQGKVVGAFCINFCITDYLNAVSLIEDFTKTVHRNEKSGKETFSSSLDETIESLIKDAIRAAGKQPATMTKEEKVNLVASLEYQGAFLIKGAVDEVARALGVTKFTIYNYLKEVKTNSAP
jgi:predicted transcriptional regulator YheO